MTIADVRAERDLIGAILISDGAAGALIEQLSLEDFYDGDTRRIFEGMLALYARGELITPETVRLELGEKQLRGGPVLIADLAREVTTAHIAPKLAERVRCVAAQRRMEALLHVALEATERGDDLGLARATLDVQAELEARAQADERFQPLDWPRLIREGVPEIRYLDPPYIIERSRTWIFGAAEAAKSMYALDVSARLSRSGRSVAYFSQENPLDEDLRRLSLLRPDADRFDFYHASSLDLADPSCVAWIIARTAERSYSLVTFDTLSACWTGDENENREIAELDRVALYPLSLAGAAVLVLDHTGHSQPLTKRDGVSAGRGASSKGQKADVVLVFRGEGPGRFSVRHAKNRLGGRRHADATFEIVDQDDGTIAIARGASNEELDVKRLAEHAVEIIGSEGSITTKKLREALAGGAKSQTLALRLLENEDGRRVRVGWESVPTEGGRQRARVWRASEKSLAPEDGSVGD